MCLNNTQVWRTADTNPTKNMNTTFGEPETLLYPETVLRLTWNMESASQNDLFVLDFDNSNANMLTLYKSSNPHAISKERLESHMFHAGPTIHVQICVFYNWWLSPYKTVPLL